MKELEVQLYLNYNSYFWLLVISLFPLLPLLAMCNFCQTKKS